jgi:hypothetical protein
VKCSAGEKRFRELLLSASKHHIPAGFQKDFKPGLYREAVDLIKERDRLREQDPQNPDLANLNQEIKNTIPSNSKKLWQESVSSSKPKANPDKFWRLMGILSGKRPHQTNQSSLEINAIASWLQLQIDSVVSLHLLLCTSPVILHAVSLRA